VRSPVDWVVMELMTALGESTSNRPLAKVANLDPPYVEIIVKVDFFERIRIDMDAEVTPRFPGATPRRATVRLVDRVVDAASDSFGVRLELANPDFEIPGGVRCGIRFEESLG
jgi:multidrug efflux pump subunit AcrA (membrane-fusion protein)